MSLTAILVAVEEEFRAIRRRMPRADRVSAGGIAFVRGELGGREVVLAKSGMGSQRAFAATRALIDEAKPDEIVIAGFCAGLRQDIVPGDLVVATSVMDFRRTIAGAGAAEPTAGFVEGLPEVVEICPAPGESLERARGVSVAGTRIHCGAVVTCGRVLRIAEEKRRLSGERDAAATDMESLSAVAAANAAGVPWLVVRAVTDGVDDDLPLDFGRFIDASGEAARGRIAAHVAIRPWLVPALIRLGARSALAARNLAAFVEQYVGSHSERATFIS